MSQVHFWFLCCLKLVKLILHHKLMNLILSVTCSSNVCLVITYPLSFEELMLQINEPEIVII